MKPVNNKFFGPDGIKCVFTIDDSGATSIGYIVKQVGDRRYVVTNDTVTKVCRLAQPGDDVHDLNRLTPGLCTIIISDSESNTANVCYLTADRCYTTGLTNHSWHLDDPADGVVQIIEPSLGYTFHSLGVVDGMTCVPVAISFDGSKICLVGQTGSENHVLTWTEEDGFVDLNFPGQFTPFDMNFAGDKIVGTGNNHAYLWDSLGFHDLGVLLGGDQSAATAISENGVVTGSAYVGSEYHLMTWTLGSGMVDRGIPSGMRTAGANCISNDGTIIAGQCTDLAFNNQSFIWTQSDGFNTSMGSFNDSDSGGFSAMSGNGTILYGSSYLGGSKSVRWTQATGYLDLGIIAPATDSFPANMSDDGSILIGIDQSTGFHRESWYWTESGGMKKLVGFFPGGAARAAAISGDGKVIAGIAVDSESAVKIVVWKK
jgi:uncharacterized membrane protein